MPTVVFQMQGGQEKAVPCASGENLLDIARRAGVAIDAPCSGSGSCGKCRVKLLAGEAVSESTQHISPEEFAQGWRLSCGTRAVGDCVFSVPEAAGAYRGGIKTADLSGPRERAVFSDCLRRLRESGIPMENRFRAFCLEMPQPTLGDTLPDNERLMGEIQAHTGVQKVELPFCVLSRLAHILRQNAFRVCVKGELAGDTFRCMDISAPEDTAIVGCAIDIGTTTVTAALADLSSGRLLAEASCGNGQIRYGADVISRILQQARPGGRKALQDAVVRETLYPMLTELCSSAGVSASAILRLCVGANTTMNHLLLGADAQSIRTEPYVPSFFRWDGLLAQDLRLPASPVAPVLLAPNIGSYVGGDITAGVLASGIWDRDEMSLFIDLGTNGEIVFGNRDFLVSCACSAGPAFEGGDISCGMRATDGAAEACIIDKATMEPTLRILGPAGQKCTGICGSGIIDLVAELYRTGILDARGRFAREGSRIRRDAHGIGRYVLAEAAESGTGREISVSEVDIDNFIRAKAAIFSGIDTLLKSVDMTVERIDRIYVAGGIGSGINMHSAVTIGMFPDVEPEKFQYIGNSSLAGAYAMVMSDRAAEKCAEIAANMTYLELSTCQGYMDSFVAACFLPHTDARRFPHSVRE